ncbi:MAG: zf-HC2 domain-containing protein [Egibacteraceae bacterium]
MNCDGVQARFGSYLRHALDPQVMAAMRKHLDRCEDCWVTWNRFRWDKAAGTSLYQDLKEFLGERFIYYFDSSRELAREWEEVAPTCQTEVENFYRQSVSYLYNLTVWEASGNRPPYAQRAAAKLAREGSSVILDYGCGIGSDVIRLRELGFTVVPCDFISPSVEFLQWRLDRLGQPTNVFEPHELDSAPKPDTLWIIDTIDHLPCIEKYIGCSLSDARFVACENLSSSRAHGKQGFHYRRGFDEIETVFNRYGLYLAASDSPTDPLMYWKARRKPEPMAGSSASGSDNWPDTGVCLTRKGADVGRWPGQAKTGTNPNRRTS